MDYPPIELVEWIDATNIAIWTDLEDIPAWAHDGGYEVRSVGYNVYEDDDCVVLAARAALNLDDGGNQVGLFERIPKGIITRRQALLPEHHSR